MLRFFIPIPFVFFKRNVFKKQYLTKVRFHPTKYEFKFEHFKTEIKKLKLNFYLAMCCFDEIYLLINFKLAALYQVNNFIMIKITAIKSSRH